MSSSIIKIRAFFGSENPHFVIEKTLHPQRMIVWYAMFNHGIIGQIFVDGTMTAEDFEKWFSSPLFKVTLISTRYGSCKMELNPIELKKDLIYWRNISVSTFWL